MLADICGNIQGSIGPGEAGGIARQFLQDGIVNIQPVAGQRGEPTGGACIGSGLMLLDIGDVSCLLSTDISGKNKG